MPGPADSLAALAEPLGDLVAEGRLQEIPGVGEAIADIITKMHRTGSHPNLEAMRKDIPAGVLGMLDVPGLRPDKVLKLYEALGITSLAELEQAARDDRIKATKGLGASLQTKILQNIEIAKSGETRLHMHRAAKLLENAGERLKHAQPDLTRVSIAGDLRRGCELVETRQRLACARKGQRLQARRARPLEGHQTHGCQVRGGHLRYVRGHGARHPRPLQEAISAPI
jgi:DNA polymerase (family X)